MLNVFKNLPFFKKHQEEIIDPDEIIAEKWEADFTNPDQTRFELRDMPSHTGFIEDKSLVLALKRQNCLAWIENPLYRYGDFVIQAVLRIDALGGYAAAGISFRMVDEVTNYILLISSKGYFRIDVLRNRNPLPMLGWTEIPGDHRDTEKPVQVKIIASGNHFIFVINGQWAAEMYDDTLPEGQVGFVSASYLAGPEKIDGEHPQVSRAYLDSFSIESRILEVEAVYEEWNHDEKKSSASRRRLAETYFAMGQADDSLTQLKYIWDKKDYSPGSGELLLAAKASMMLMNLDDAEIYLNTILDSPDSDAADLEKARFLYLAERYQDLRKYALGLLEKYSEDLTLRTLLGHAYWNLKDFSAAAAAYDQAAALDQGNGIPAKNAANAYDILGEESKALERYLKAGRHFLKNNNYNDLGSVIPRLLYLDPRNWEVHALTGKWAFGVEDWQKAGYEFGEAERLRLQDNTNPPEDPALVFLQGLLLIQKGKRQEALAFLEKALALDDGHSIFHFKLAETRFLLYGDPRDDEMKKHIAIALQQDPDDGWIANMAAQVALAGGDLESAAVHLLKAAESLGEVPAIRVNRAVLAFLKGSADEALELLEANRSEDPEGIMANCAGNLLVRLTRYEDAEAYYRKALSIAPDNLEYMLNHASCLIEMGLYGEADALLARIHSISPTPDVLELIAFVAAQKAEYPRAEAALQAALEMAPGNISAIVSLGWIYANTFRWKELEEILNSLDSMDLNDDSRKQYLELKEQFEQATLKTISCAACDRKWRVSKNYIDVPPIRLFSEPPDDLPAGTCPECGKTYCVGCAKNSIDEDGRFLCRDCGKNLKLTDPGLKKIISDWASRAFPEKKKKGRPKKDSRE